MKSLSIIIVSYNKYEILKQCLESIFEFNDIGNELEVIVSDNSDDYVLYNKLLNDFPQVIAVKNNNIGFGKGNNRGFFRSSGKYLLFLNPDTILFQPIFKFTIDKFDKDQSLALFGVKLFTKDLKPNSSFFLMDDYKIYSTLRFKKHQKNDVFIDGKMYIAGADLFVRRNIFVDAGMFDENIFMYYEEPDLIRRIHSLSVPNKVSYFNEVGIIHLEGGTEDDDMETHLKRVARSLETYKYYCLKWKLSFKENLKYMKKYQAFKWVICLIVRNRYEAEISKKMIMLIDKQLNTEK